MEQPGVQFTPEVVDLVGPAALPKLGHELRGPLSGIISLAGLMSRKLGQGPVRPEQLVTQLQLIGSSAAELLHTVERLVLLARLDQPAGAGDPAPFDCRALVQEVVTAHHPEAAARDRRVVVELPPDAVLVTGDPEALRRLLAEVLDNAIKYTNQPDVQVTVGGAAGGAPAIAVRDQGPGLTGDELRRAFLPFERGAAAHERDEPGTGLGLCLAQRCARRCGATLSATASPAGTTVTVAFGPPPAP
ncbi:sensor histidine kinase [Couchioplanes azureus]|uniref:sensor histidine kinase n=1 Tax=Couchioplanes caeruleus TaxID=56438 RepID=UPI0016713298|nr:HAMP domain-containing sensor histidine kinase [Couchioplanes caeruleus]